MENLECITKTNRSTNYLVSVLAIVNILEREENVAVPGRLLDMVGKVFEVADEQYPCNVHKT